MTDSPSEQAGKGNQKNEKKVLGKELPPPRPAGIQPQQIAMECGAAIGKGEMEKFVQSFQQSAKRWEVIVYPALFAFSVLAAYGFFLIYSLTSDMTMMARSMDPNMGEHMDIMSESIVQLSEQVHVMSQQVQLMSSTMVNISEKLDTLPPMLSHIGSMDKSMLSMDTSMQDMRGSMKSMTGSMINMDNSMVHMDTAMTHMDKSIASMDKSIGGMNDAIVRMDKTMAVLEKSVRLITATTDQMRLDMTAMSHNIGQFSRPMSFMNNMPMMPW